MLSNDPVPISISGRWRITFAEDLPEGSWREAFLAKAQATPVGRALGLSFEGTTLEFDCPDSLAREARRLALQSRIRLINELLKETKPKAPGQ